MNEQLVYGQDWQYTPVVVPATHANFIKPELSGEETP